MVAGLLWHIVIYAKAGEKSKKKKKKSKAIKSQFSLGLDIFSTVYIFFQLSLSLCPCRIPYLSYFISLLFPLSLSVSLSVVYMVTWFYQFLMGRTVHCLPTFLYPCFLSLLSLYVPEATIDSCTVVKSPGSVRPVRFLLSLCVCVCVRPCSPGPEAGRSWAVCNWVLIWHTQTHMKRTHYEQRFAEGRPADLRSDQTLIQPPSEMNTPLIFWCSVCVCVYRDCARGLKRPRRIMMAAGFVLLKRVCKGVCAHTNKVHTQISIWWPFCTKPGSL